MCLKIQQSDKSFSKHTFPKPEGLHVFKELQGRKVFELSLII